jgi:gliding motility-associated-like protein
MAVHAKPILTDLTPDQSIKYGSSIQLNASGADYYFWMPNNGTLNDPNINAPIATPLDSTTYIVIGTDSAGCRDTATIAISIDYNADVFIPSAFTPNGDGKNDVFRIVNIKYQKLLGFSVFNRWGQLVFYTTNPDQGWDGTFNGIPQNIGTYDYMIVLSLPDGTEKLYKGEVTLIR